MDVAIAQMSEHNGSHVGPCVAYFRTNLLDKIFYGFDGHADVEGNDWPPREKTFDIVANGSKIIALVARLGDGRIDNQSSFKCL